jgi:hypothetical protein
MTARDPVSEALAILDVELAAPISLWPAMHARRVEAVAALTPQDRERFVREYAERARVLAAERKLARIRWAS